MFSTDIIDYEFEFLMGAINFYYYLKIVPTLVFKASFSAKL